MKKFLALIAVIVTLFTFAPTSAEAGPSHCYPSHRSYTTHSYRAPVRYYSSHSYRPVYQSRRTYTSASRYYPSYRSSHSYAHRYSSCNGSRGTSVSIHTRFGSFHFR